MANDLALICDACKEFIDDGSGYLWIDTDAVATAERAHAEQHRKHTYEVESSEAMLSYLAGDLFRLPEVVRWQAHHADCDPTPGAAAFPIPAVDIRTWPDLIECTAQLMEKPWLGHTDWNYLLRGAVQGDTRLIAVS